MQGRKCWIVHVINFQEVEGEFKREGEKKRKKRKENYEFSFISFLITLPDWIETSFIKIWLKFRQTTLGMMRINFTVKLVFFAFSWKVNENVDSKRQVERIGMNIMNIMHYHFVTSIHESCNSLGMIIITQTDENCLPMMLMMMIIISLGSFNSLRLVKDNDKLYSFSHFSF